MLLATAAKEGFIQIFYCYSFGDYSIRSESRGRHGLKSCPGLSGIERPTNTDQNSIKMTIYLYIL